ncbi:AlbA family DNA-binding domain-containing protein [Microbacterium xylanilyticum]
MLHTPLHRLLGENPGPITDQMINDAVAQGIPEGDQLDWKRGLPPEKDFRDSHVKDIAAFANADGGIIVFGVTDTGAKASGRHDAGELNEGYERTIRQVCMSAITPPVFGVEAIAIPAAEGSPRAVALVIPASTDGPHLIFRDDRFGAPLRTGADTIWMKEPQIESAYRARFDGARRSELALQQIYEDMVAAVTPTAAAVLVGAARPRRPQYHAGRRDTATPIADRATLLARWWLSGLGEYGPLEHIDIYPDRPTLGGLYMPPKAAGDTREAHAVVLDDGSVGLSWRAGGHPHEKTNEPYAAHQIPPLAVEAFAATLLALVRTVAEDAHSGDYEVMLGVEMAGSTGRTPEFHIRNAAPPSGVHRPLNPQFRPVRIIADPATNDHDFIQAPIDLATLALNQVGIKEPTILNRSLPRRPQRYS